MIQLTKHSYKYFPYELELAQREIKALLPKVQLLNTERGYQLDGEYDLDITRRLTYFSSLKQDDIHIPTTQALLEKINGNEVKRQSTRYSSHGLHEYKGKFNPQIVRAMLNILNISVGSRVIDPFCGSGTSLVECRHLGMNVVGTDINPLAVFIANAKLKAIEIPAKELICALNAVIKLQGKTKKLAKSASIARDEYLLSWFDKEAFEQIERVRFAIQKVGGSTTDVLLTIASNLLREYSQQDPNDLRIRRRKTPIPDIPFVRAFEQAASQFIEKLSDAQNVLESQQTDSMAVLLDSRLANQVLEEDEKYDCALTSPPYATALPYIDTQRLSLVWLSLIPPSEILPLEAQLIGSREVRGKQAKKMLLSEMENNSAKLPKKQADYCTSLQRALSDTDGFRRQAVPLLLYRYFSGMADMFRSLHPKMKKNAPFALVIGGNHTVLGGERFDIDTPNHIADIAISAGWSHTETLPLQTYQRYGYHMGNAVTKEAMIIVRAE